MKTKHILLIALCVLVAGTLVFGAFALSGNLDANTKAGTTSNPDDQTEYIQIKTNDTGGIEYSWKFGTVSGPNEVGKIALDDDYMYVYGMYYSRTTAPTTTSTTGWTNQGTVTGWGCVARSKTKSTYADPCLMINDAPVTYFARCYQNCTSMTALPAVPYTAQSTSYMCAGCTSLAKVEINGLTRLDEYTFNGCSALKKIYIGEALTTIVASSQAKSPFYGVHADCACYVQKTSAPSGYGTYWRYIASGTQFTTIKYGADYLIDYVNG